MTRGEVGGNAETSRFTSNLVPITSAPPTWLSSQLVFYLRLLVGFCPPPRPRLLRLIVPVLQRPRGEIATTEAEGQP